MTSNQLTLKTGVVKKLKALKVGTVFKNYKELCETIGVEAKGGKGKEYQLKEIGRYCKLEKAEKGNSYTVIEVYQRALPREDRKALQENLDVLLKNYIYQEFKDGTNVVTEVINGKEVKYVILTKSKIAKRFGLINESNYQLLKYHTEEYKELMRDKYNIDLHDETIEEFILGEDNKQRDRVRYAINGLRDQRLVDIGEGKGVIFYTKNNKYSNDFMNCNNYQSSIITNLEREELERLNLSKMSQLFTKSKATIKKFYKNVTKAINNYVTNAEEIEQAKKEGKEIPKPINLFSKKVKSYYSTYILMYREKLEKECYKYRTDDLVIEALNKIALKSANESANKRYNKNSTRLEVISKKGVGGRLNPTYAEERTELSKRLDSYKHENKLIITETIDRSTENRTKDINIITDKAELYNYIIKLEEIFTYFRDDICAEEYTNTSNGISGITRADIKALQKLYYNIRIYKDKSELNALSGEELETIGSMLIPLYKPKKDTKGTEDIEEVI